MTKKEKLINWARNKFNNDKCGELILLYQELARHNDNSDTPYIVTEIKYCYNLNELLEFVQFYSDRLVDYEYEKPLPEERFYESYLEDYERTKEELGDYFIDMEDMCIFNYYWKSSEDIEYFKNS